MKKNERRMGLELRQLRYFLSVADNRSFVSAAASLYISRQAVSKAISQLEAELGTDLFVRDTSGAFLTPTGMLLYERARGVVMELDALAEQIRTSGSRYLQRIRMAFAPGSLVLLEDCLIAFREGRENLQIDYSEHTQEACLHRLQEHQADMIITPFRTQNPQFISQEIVASPIGVLIRDVEGSEELDSVDITDLNWLPLAVQEDKRLQDFCTKYRLNPRFQGQDYHRLYQLTAAGRCALLLPRCMVPDRNWGLRWLPLQQEETWQLYSTYPQAAESNLLYSTVLDELTHQLKTKTNMN